MAQKLPFLLLLCFAQFVSLESIKAQGCNLKTAVVGFACTSGADLSYTEGTDCYTEMRVLLSAGTFYAWTANTADNWIVEQLAPNELLVTHSNGLFPSGDHTMLNFLYYTPGGSPTELILLYPDGCVMESCENKHPLAGCGESCISGFVYRECGEEPLTDQPKLEGFIVELSDDMGNIVGEYITGPDGSYTFCELVPGGYSVRAAIDTAKVPKQGWTARVPASGEYAFVLPPGTEEFRNFGSCPDCTCDDFDLFLHQEPGNGDTSYLNVTVAKNNPYCLERYEIAIDSGDIVQVEALSNGWEGQLIDGQHATFERVSLNSDWTNFVFHRLAIDFGIKEKGIKATVRLIGAGNQPPEPICEDTIIIEHPTKYKQFTCCPDGSIMGAELVQNGEFFTILPPATDYIYLPFPNLPGEIAIVNNVSSGFWLQINKNVSPFDHFLAVNGSTNPGLAFWKQQVSGLLAGDNYVFCGLFNNLFRSNQNADDPVIELIIEDDNSAQQWSSGLFLLPENPDSWQQFSLNWTVPTVPASSYTLKLVSHGTNPFGNDFGVDCISFRECIAVPQDTCCKDVQAFCDDLEAGILFSSDSCKITMDLSALPPCYTIEWVDWGLGPEFGPWTSSTFPYPMHTFSGNGSYPISYLAIAYDDSNFICLEKVIGDTITVLCEPCFCNDPAIYLVQNSINYQLFCSKVGPLIELPCPADDIIISGFFGCETATGELCEETVVNYVLTGPNGIIDVGSTTPFSNFIYPASIIGAPGSYYLTLSTLCPGKTDSCVCTLQWLQKDCSSPCPNNLVLNPGFWMGAVPGNLNGSGQSANWTYYGGSPQVSNSDFCADPYSIQMHDAEGICQTGFNFLQGHTYRLSFCGRFWEDPNSFATSVNFAFVGGNGCGGPNVETIGGSGSISNQSWSTYTLPDWTASQNLNTMWIRAFNVLGYTTFGRIDNICIEEVFPDSCNCGGFEDMFVRTPQGAMNMAVSCGGAPLTIPCPDPGKGFHLTGVFGCAGGACPPDHQIDWTLTHQSSGTTHSGGFQDNDPFFGIHILPTYISQPGLYTLTMTGVCNGDTCVCEVQFLIDCPDLCPCDLDDILALSSNVDKGFAVALANKSCNACFSPLAVSDCETVEWYVNSTAGAPIGASIGSQTFCYKFPFSGSYTVYMVVTRLKPDGSQCEVFVKSQIVTVLCTIFDDCLDSRLTNASFNENPIAGGLGQGGSGEAPGWVAATDNPVLMEGPADSHDGWTMLLTGCYFNSDVLSTSIPVCLSKTDSGILSLRLRTPGDPIPGVDIKQGRKPPGGNRIIIQLFNDKAAPPPDPCAGQKGGCNIIGVLEDLIPLDSTDWWDVFIPYDMNKMVWTDSCGDQSDGIPVYLSIKMANMLSADQGDGNVRDAVLIDNICLDGTLVQTEQFPTAKGIAIKPNPTTGYISIELSEEANANTTFRVMGLTGQTLLNVPAKEGSHHQVLDISTLPAGIYFVQLNINGHMRQVEKVVKQD